MTASLLGLLCGRLKLPQWLVDFLIGALVVVALAGGSYWLGWSHRGSADDAAQAKALAGAQARYETRLAQAQAKGSALVTQAQAAQAQAEQTYQQLRDEVPHVVKVVRASPGAACPSAPSAQPSMQLDGQPDGRLDGEFSGAFVGLWNRALDAGLSLPGGAGRAAPASGGAAAADAPGDIDQRDIIENHIDNAERAAACRRQLNALIDWERSR
jgi:hypothetical protein